MDIFEFEDTFAPHARHVYQIARQGFDPKLLLLADPAIAPYLFTIERPDLLIDRFVVSE